MRAAGREGVPDKHPSVSRTHRCEASGANNSPAPNRKKEAPSEQTRFSGEKTYYLVPECKAPEQVADASVAVAAASQGVCAWQFTGSETMHPCWAVLRATKEELAKKRAAEPTSNLPARFNVVQAITEFNCVSVGQVNGQSQTAILQVHVPLVTNESVIRKGKRLVMEHAPEQNCEETQNV